MTSFRALLPFQKRYIDFLLAMTEKEIKTRYRFSLLGFFWIILKPLVQMMVMGMVFQFFIPVKVNNYFLFLFVGLLPWEFFSTTVSKNTPIIVQERMLIEKANFPREVIVLSTVLSNFFHFLVAFSLLLLALTADKIMEGYTLVNIIIYLARMLFSLPLCVWLAFITSGFSLLFSALNVRYRDVNFIIQVIMPLWFYCTPIVYTLDLLPSYFRQFFFLNPVTGIIQLFQSILLNQPIMPFQYILFNFVTGIAICFFGWKLFQKESPFFSDWI